MTANYQTQIYSLDICSYLRASLAFSTTEAREQSLEPYPVLQVHDAVHDTSRIVQPRRTLPEGSEKPHTPWPEHTEPAVEM